MTKLSQFTINVRKSHRQPQCTLQLVCQDRVLCARGDLNISLFSEQHPKFERPIRLVYSHFFPKLRSSPNSTNKNLTELGTENQTALCR